MQRHYLKTALTSGGIVGLFTLYQYGFLARSVQRLLASGEIALGPGGNALQPWVGPSLLIPTLALFIGAVAGWLATRGPEAGRLAGARAGGAAGLGALAATTIVLTGLLAWVGTDPVVQEFVRMSEPHPEARLSPAAIPWVAAGVGALIGLTVGAQSFATALFGGAIADVLHGRGEQAAPRLRG